MLLYKLLINFLKIFCYFQTFKPKNYVPQIVSYTYTYTHTHTHIYTYIYIYRYTDRETETYTHTHTHRRTRTNILCGNVLYRSCVPSLVRTHIDSRSFCLPSRSRIFDLCCLSVSLYGQLFFNLFFWDQEKTFKCSGSLKLTHQIPFLLAKFA